MTPGDFQASGPDTRCGPGASGALGLHPYLGRAQPRIRLGRTQCRASTHQRPGRRRLNCHVGSIPTVSTFLTLQTLGDAPERLLFSVRLVACSAETTAGHLKGFDIYFVLGTSRCALHLNQVLERCDAYGSSVEIHDVGVAAQGGIPRRARRIRKPRSLALSAKSLYLRAAMLRSSLPSNLSIFSCPSRGRRVPGPSLAGSTGHESPIITPSRPRAPPRAARRDRRPPGSRRS